ncbi:MAG: hypothetical protein NUV61_01340 [Candidatus Azambacteria bacterium]|nr:hypothetical protein [Candidatus Azambacteria bacterium]
MIPKKKLVVTFRGPEVEALSRVTDRMNEPSEQDAIRTLVKNYHSDNMTLPPYKQKTGSGERGPNKAQRLNEILAITDYDVLNAELERLHVFEEFKSRSDMRVWVEDDGIGGRIGRYNSPSGGDFGNINFGEIMKVLQKII